MLKLSIIVPVLNEADNIETTLLPLQKWRQQGHEVIIADGGSKDATIKLARPLADHLIDAPRGRARQMNAGAQLACGDVLLFLHADTCLPDDTAELIQKNVQTKSWGRFDIQLSGKQPLLRVVEFMMNWRSRLNGIASGDQAIFVRRDLFEAIGGYADIPLMEDINISTRLRRHCHPACIRTRLTTSSRRWEQYGILRTILRMWWLRLAYYSGVKPEWLARHYDYD